ncbi:copper resistance protein CopC [Micromonospora zhanjiangensis]|uniref:Copper resistance protein CopC n=1 Tax=Micromonospora zhanjiangensis TaxID=1522057 RepID=A0ABV8KHV2_9ACTN
MEASVGGGVRRSAVRLPTVVTGLLCALLPAGPAAAHNSLTSSDPANRARLAKAPARLRPAFAAKLDPAATKITITGPDRRRPAARRRHRGRRAGPPPSELGPASRTPPAGHPVVRAAGPAARIVTGWCR